MSTPNNSTKEFFYLDPPSSWKTHSGITYFGSLSIFYQSIIITLCLFLSSFYLWKGLLKKKWTPVLTEPKNVAVTVVSAKNSSERKVSRVRRIDSADERLVPLSVNYHFTRRCNYSCGFCFHTAKTSFKLPLEEAKKGLEMLAHAGMEKINFSGGEPFLENRGEYLGKLVQFCKEELVLPSVSIVSNGSLIRESWFRAYGKYLDILAISCDSFNEDTNKAIGRGQGNKNHVEKLKVIRNWCAKYKVAFKINTVVNTYNKDEDMTQELLILQPIRWKVFQCLLLEGENVGPDALRNAEQFYITNEEFQDFLDAHHAVPFLVPESNVKMQNSYLILDEYMRFLDCRNGKKTPSMSLLDVGVDDALNYSGFDEKMFFSRGGKYVWSKSDMKLDF